MPRAMNKPSASAFLRDPPAPLVVTVSCPPTNPLDLYAHFRCFVMGSWSEGTSISLIEAMACGIPPVVTAVGGNPDVLGTELAGQLAPSGDVAALAARIGATIEPDAARCIGELARRRIEREFDLGGMVRAYEAIYLGQPLT